MQRKRKKNLKKRSMQLLSFLLALVMVVELVPMTGLAAAGRTGVNDAVVTSYAELAAGGDEQQAREDLDVLYEAGIIDENGSMVELDIRENGECVELTDLTRRIAEGEIVGDLSVNGHDAIPEQVAQIQQVNTMLEVVRLLDQDIDVTDKHVENLQALIEEIADDSIDMDEVIEEGMLSLSMADGVEALYSGDSGNMETTDGGKYTQPFIDGSTYEESYEFDFLVPENTSWYSKAATSGIGLDGTVTLSCAYTATAGGTLTITATLDKAQSVPVSFDWAAAGGGIGASGSGTVTWAAGESGDKTFAVTVAEKDESEYWDGGRAFVINAGNIQNAPLRMERLRGARL